MYQRSQTNDGADKYYLDVTSTLSLVKTSVYLVETAVSDLFLVSLSNNFLPTHAMLI